MKRSPQIEFGISLQTWASADRPFCAYSFIWLNDKVFRSMVHKHLQKAISKPFKYEWEDQTSYVSVYGRKDEQDLVIEGLPGTFRSLISSLGELPDFRKLIGKLDGSRKAAPAQP